MLPTQAQMGSGGGSGVDTAVLQIAVGVELVVHRWGVHTGVVKEGAWACAGRRAQMS